MREILFCGKRLDNGEWVEGLLTVMWGQYHIINPSDENTAYPVDPETVGQFTGLADQKGNRAFTDSVIRYSGEYGHVVYGIVRFGEIPTDFGTNANHIGFYVEWQNSGANEWNEWWRHDLAFWLKDRRCEIIGNRWNNPELLEVRHEHRR